MAYYSSSYAGEFSSSDAYYTTYDYAPPQDSDLVNHQQSFEYGSNPFFATYDQPVYSYSGVSYSASSFSEAKYVQYDPGILYPVETRFIVSYSVSEFNEPEFDEYDPTPYGGGYDIAATYGKPLPPSDQICYPPSFPSASSVTGIVAPDEKKEPEEAAPAQKPETETQKEGDEEVNFGQQDKHSDMVEYGNGNAAGRSGEHGYYGVPQVVEASQVPSGYGLEAMDLCESLFGYWPCLSRIRRNNAHDCPEEVDNNDHLCGNSEKGTADYIFGSLDPYGRDGEGNCGNVIYGYQRHYPDHPTLYQQQVEYVEDIHNSWL